MSETILRPASERQKKHAKPFPKVTVTDESDLSSVEGQVIDAFCRVGHREIERRVALQYNNYPITKERVMLLGDEHAKDQFLSNIFGDGEGECEGIGDYKVIDRFKVENFKLADKVFSNEYLTKQLARHVDKSLATVNPITTIVNIWPDPTVADKYLKWFAETCRTVRVFNILYADPTGKGRILSPRFSSDDLWDTQSAFEEEKDLPWVIELIAHIGESTWFGALPKQMKTWVMLCVVKALLTGQPLFNDPRFKVPEAATKVIYLIPEASRPSVKKRLVKLGLIQYLYDPISNREGKLFIRTLSAGQKIELTDPRLLLMVKDADVFLDTAIRWLKGSENDSTDVAV